MTEFFLQIKTYWSIIYKQYNIVNKEACVFVEVGVRVPSPIQEGHYGGHQVSAAGAQSRKPLLWLEQLKEEPQDWR